MTDATTDAGPDGSGPAPTARAAPSHVPHAVRRGSDGRVRWTPIGVGFAHGKATGVNLSLDCLPRDGRIVVRDRARDGEADASPRGDPVAGDAVARGGSPTHIVWHVRKARDGRSFWTGVGTGFAHDDGRGWNLRVDLLPVDGALVVLERARPGAGDPAGADAAGIADDPGG